MPCEAHTTHLHASRVRTTTPSFRSFSCSYSMVCSRADSSWFSEITPEVVPFIFPGVRLGVFPEIRLGISSINHPEVSSGFRSWISSRVLPGCLLKFHLAVRLEILENVKGFWSCLNDFPWSCAMDSHKIYLECLPGYPPWNPPGCTGNLPWIYPVVSSEVLHRLLLQFF